MKFQLHEGCFFEGVKVRRVWLNSGKIEQHYYDTSAQQFAIEPGACRQVFSFPCATTDKDEKTYIYDEVCEGFEPVLLIAVLAEILSVFDQKESKGLLFLGHLQSQVHPLDLL